MTATPFQEFQRTYKNIYTCRLEKVNILKMGSQAKILGTIVTVGGAMVMTFIRGPMLNLPWTSHNQLSASSSSASAAIHQDPLKGSLIIASGCICWSAFIILQVKISSLLFWLMDIGVCRKETNFDVNGVRLLR